MTATHPDLGHDPEGGFRQPCPCAGCGRPDTPEAAAHWHRRKGPEPLLRARHETPYPLLLPWWVDHPYRLRLPDGRWRYVAEPYELSPDDLDDLADLEAHGWRVTVTAWQARHFPGHTLAVVIEPEQEQQ